VADNRTAAVRPAANLTDNSKDVGVRKNLIMEWAFICHRIRGAKRFKTSFGDATGAGRQYQGLRVRTQVLKTIADKFALKNFVRFGWAKGHRFGAGCVDSGASGPYVSLVVKPATPLTPAAGTHLLIS
jgi:hypothetical protein